MLLLPPSNLEEFLSELSVKQEKCLNKRIAKWQQLWQPASSGDSTSSPKRSWGLESRGNRQERKKEEGRKYDKEREVGGKEI